MFLSNVLCKSSLLATKKKCHGPVIGQKWSMHSIYMFCSVMRDNYLQTCLVKALILYFNCGGYVYVEKLN